MLARAAVGPAERLLNMLGERKQCAAVYAGAFAINLALCVILIPRIGIEGAAVATSSAMVVESIVLYRRRQAPARLPRLHSAAAGRPRPCSRNSRRITLPVVVIGISSMKATSRGYSCADSRVRTKP